MAFSDNRVAYWKFDEASGNAVDSSGNGNTLANNNSTPFVAGRVNNGANLVAANKNYFSIADNVQTGLDITGDFSTMFWIKLASQPTGAYPYFHLLNKWEEVQNQRSFSITYKVVAGVSTLYFAIPNDLAGSGASDIYAIDNIILNTGVWKHVTIKWKASTHTATFFINGLKVGSSRGSAGYTSIPNGTAKFLISSYFSDASQANSNVGFIDGIIDEVMLWSRVLTDFEIINYYNSIQLPTIAMPTFYNVS